MSGVPLNRVDVQTSDYDGMEATCLRCKERVAVESEHSYRILVSELVAAVEAHECYSQAKAADVEFERKLAEREAFYDGLRRA